MMVEMEMIYDDSDDDNGGDSVSDEKDYDDDGLPASSHHDKISQCQ